MVSVSDKVYVPCRQQLNHTAVNVIALESKAECVSYTPLSLMFSHPITLIHDLGLGVLQIYWHTSSEICRLMHSNVVA